MGVLNTRQQGAWQVERYQALRRPHCRAPNGGAALKVTEGVRPLSEAL